VVNKKIKRRALARASRTRNKLVSKGVLPRLTVFRSLSNIYAQIIDDATHSTLVSASSLLIEDKKGDKKAIAKQVGLKLGKMAMDKSVATIFFDRGRYRYHGRVSALAEGLREAGLKF